MHSSWKNILAPEFEKPYFKSLLEFVRAERAKGTVYPPVGYVFSAFNETPFDDVRVLILGQDPYHGPSQAHGLCFSVPPGVSIPPSLHNIFAELKSDLGVDISGQGCLIKWAKQGVFLLNSVLTVRARMPASHQNRGWETFTDSVIRVLSDRNKPMVFVLWGRYAQAKSSLIGKSHVIIESSHPSPMSAHSGFFGSRPFSKINAALIRLGSSPIDWRI